MSDKNLFLIAGPNGSGKTTSSFDMLKACSIDEYVNADAIAYGLSPLQYDTVAIKSGRLMLERIHYLLEQNKSFAFETTLASRSFFNLYLPLVDRWAFYDNSTSSPEFVAGKLIKNGALEILDSKLWTTLSKREVENVT